MPEPLKKQENQVGHRTQAEKARRARAEESLVRTTRINMRAPEWLSEEGRRVFEQTKKRMRGLQVLDTADIDVLALYADAVAQYRQKQRLVELAMKMLERKIERDAPRGDPEHGAEVPVRDVVLEEEEEKDLKKVMDRAEKAELMMLQWSRVVISYAEKLGISANARARLARKKAMNEEPQDELGALLDEFVGMAKGGR